ncbi:MAG: AAA family ATPase [Bacteroidaceae bacterium]|nr:AAA family ATPase [Bacteroidaceae bacterium]MBR3895714.1 AAA family ATPase [Bacteroidaceae bacterium]
MIYLKHFNLAGSRVEEDYLNYFKRTCFDSYYPFLFFPNKGLEELDFADITIFCGGNGSGKSTLLNIISEKLGLTRTTPFNKTYFFDPYLDACSCELTVSDPVELRNLMGCSQIITSDDVFNHIIAVREKNKNIDFKRQLIFDERDRYKKYGWTGERPRGFSMDDPESMKVYRDYANKLRRSNTTSRLVRDNVGYSERTYSNGENGFKYFTDAIQPGGLYLLDEPENSLSTEMQLKLVQFLQGMARFYDCQFIISSHSPFILSLPYARIYNLDEYPVSVCKWTELPNVRLYYEFFKEQAAEFEG